MVLPQRSCTVYVKVWVRVQLLFSMTGPGVQTTARLRSPSQLSAAVTAGEQLGRSTGLQPSSPPAGRLARIGAVVSSFQV